MSENNQIFRAEGKEVAFRADAAFAKPEIYGAVEERGVKYALRISANENLERDITELLTRPAGRPSHRPVVWYKSFLYQAASWKTARRVVAKVEFHFGELFPRAGFSVTNLSLSSRAIVRFYNKRAEPSNGSRKASRRRIGPGCRVIGSGPMKCAYS
jgi:Transposase DDE domain group 1